jgi:hypothetical protein
MDVMPTLVEHGMLLASARGPIPNVAEIVAGEPITGSWWGHPAGHHIFDVLNDLAASPDVARLRLVRGRVTLVHRRLWPALVRLEDRFDPAALAAIDEEHTPSGRHRTTATAFPDWVPAEVMQDAARLSDDEALALLPDCLRGPG